MKRTKSIALVLVISMFASLFGVFPVISAGAIPVITQINNEEPAILATVGTAVTLANYSVELDDGTVLTSANITWYNGANAITSFTPSTSGVTTLIAKKTADLTVTKNIYVVAKIASATEYVLYSNDFSSTTLDGWNTSLTASSVSVADGKLTIDAVGKANQRVYLPSWLGDFANYRIDAVGTQTNPTDASRWVSFMFRAQTPAATVTPYYHMCVRNNMMAGATSTTGGVECVSQTSAGYVYYKSTSYTETMSAAKDYTFSILAKDRTLQYQINGDKVIHYTDLPSIATATASNVDKGQVGLQVNSSKLVLNSIKISIQEAAPVAPVVSTDTTLINANQPDSNTLNHITNIGVVQSLAEFQSYNTTPANAPATLVFYANGANLTTKSGTAICTISQLMALKDDLPYIPAFYVKDNATVDTLVTALKAASFVDVLFISDSTTVAKYARQSYTIARSAIDFSSMTGSTLSDAQLLKIRGDVKSSLSLIAILPANLAVKEYVSELQSLAASVWVMDDTLSGDTEAAKLITSGATGIITNNFAAINTALNTLIVDNTLTKTAVIIGHRGNPTQAPENSISSYLKAIENGADVVETDIYLTSDKEVVIMHDTTIDRTTNGSGTVSAMTLAQIKQYFLWGDNDAYKTALPNEKVPTFEEMLIAVKPTDAKIFIELKSSDINMVQPTVDLINEYDMEDRVCVISFSAAQLAKFQQLMPTMSTGNLNLTFGVSTTMVEALNSFYTTFSSAQSTNSTINPSYGNISQYTAAVAIDRGVTVWPWTFSVSSAATFNNQFLWGIDGLTTNDSQYSKNMVKNISSNKSSVLLAGNGSSGSYVINSLTYGGTETNISSNASSFIKILEGGDLITVSNGTVTAKAATGTASFMVGYTTKTAANSTYVLYTQPITVVIGAEGGIIPVEGSDYVKGDYLTGVEDATSLTTFLSNFELSENLVVLDKDGNEITTGTALIGTGSTVQYLSGSTVVDEITVVVLGDISGDGKIDAKDYLFAKRAFLKTITLSATQLKAGCLSGSALPTATDYLKIKRHVLGTYNIFA